MRELYLIEERRRQARIAALYIMAALALAGAFAALVIKATNGAGV